MSKLKINIAICTWNRAELLKEALDCLTKLTIPEDIDLEVIVVNNNCTDHTDDIIKSFKNKLSLIHAHEKKPGLSHARNKAVELATGDYIIWTDDDVLVDKDWILAYSNFFLSHPDFDVFGGPILPYYEKTPPAWLSNSIDIVSDAFALRNMGNQAIPFKPHTEYLPFGANYAIKLTTQKQYRYSPELGRQPNNISLLGEETLVINQILDSGKKGSWVPEAMVNHRVPADRQTLEYISDYFIGKGKSIGYIPNANDTLFIGKPIWLIRQVFVLKLKFIYHRLFSSERVWLQVLKQKNINIGLLQTIKK